MCLAAILVAASLGQVRSQTQSRSGAAGLDGARERARDRIDWHALIGEFLDGNARQIQIVEAEWFQEELKLSDEQKWSLESVIAERAKARAVSMERDDDEQRERREEIDAQAWKAIDKTLKEEQKIRLVQLVFQVASYHHNAGRLLTSECLARQLELTDKQKQAIKQRVEATDKAADNVYKTVDNEFESYFRLQGLIRSEQKDIFEKILTHDQRKQWGTVLGERFKIFEVSGRTAESSQ